MYIWVYIIVVIFKRVLYGFFGYSYGEKNPIFGLGMQKIEGN